MRTKWWKRTRSSCNSRHEPVTLVLTRQAMPTFDRTKYGAASGVAKGAYIFADADGGKPDVILIGTGSEVALCVDAYEKLKTEGIKARVVSMPSWELFEKQDDAYKESVSARERHRARFRRDGCHVRVGALRGPEGQR